MRLELHATWRTLASERNLPAGSAFKTGNGGCRPSHARPVGLHERHRSIEAGFPEHAHTKELEHQVQHSASVGKTQ